MVVSEQGLTLHSVSLAGRDLVGWLCSWRVLVIKFVGYRARSSVG